MSIAQIISLLFSLKAQLAVLQNELLSLQNASTSAQVSSTPIGFVPWTPHAWNPPTSTPQSPVLDMPLGVGEPTGIQEVALGNVELDVEKESLFLDPIESDIPVSSTIFYTGTRYPLSFFLFDQNGNPITNASATIMTDDPIPSGVGWETGETEVNSSSSENTVFSLVGADVSNPTTANPENNGYIFEYTPQTDGTHTIMVTALGTTQTITVNSGAQ